jgi:hypothetical protein
MKIISINLRERQKGPDIMTRNGKIARLPLAIREHINRRLQNGGEGKQIAEWLNTLPEVQALMTAEFDGQPINQNNVSNWKAGGYKDWEDQQEALATARSLAADAGELHEEGGGHLALFSGNHALCVIVSLPLTVLLFPIQTP